MDLMSVIGRVGPNLQITPLRIIFKASMTKYLYALLCALLREKIVVFLTIFKFDCRALFCTPIERQI